MGGGEKGAWLRKKKKVKYEPVKKKKNARKKGRVPGLDIPAFTRSINLLEGKKGVDHAGRTVTLRTREFKSKIDKGSLKKELLSPD